MSRTILEMGADVAYNERRMHEEFIGAEVCGTSMRIATLRRDGPRAPIVFLHGFGSSKEDFADIVRFQQFDNHGVLAFDAPGCGVSECSNLAAITVEFLQQVARQLIRHYDISEYHLVGHSMGGLTALLLADRDPVPVLSFTNIEGNLHPDDCFLSRQIIDQANSDPQNFIAALIARTKRTPEYSTALFASNLTHKVRPAAVEPIFRSMVDLSDNGSLLERFVRLPCPTLFMFGDDSHSLLHIECLQAHSVQLAKIPHCGHFPMYANPTEMWSRIGEFIAQVEEDRSHE